MFNIYNKDNVKLKNNSNGMQYLYKNSIFGFYNSRTITILAYKINLNSCKRYYPGGSDVGKKFVTNLAPANPLAPCQGAGCAIRPLINSKPNNRPILNPPDTPKSIPTQEITTESANAFVPKNNAEFNHRDFQKFNSDSNKAYANLNQKTSPNNNNDVIQVPSVTPEVDNVNKNGTDIINNATNIEESKPVTGDLMKQHAINDAIGYMQSPNKGIQKQTRALKDQTQQDIQPANKSLNDNITEKHEIGDIIVPPVVFEMPGDSLISSDIPPMAEITVEFDSEGILYAIPNPPPLPPMKTITVPQQTIGNFCDKILGLKPQEDNTNIKPSQVKAALLELEKRNLLHYINNEEKLSKAFYNYYKKLPEQLITLDITLDTLYKNNKLKVGMLQINDPENTVLLNGMQSHVVVLYTEQNNWDVILGFLTSDKSSGIILSSEQPFVFENKREDKGQYYTMLQEPLVIKDPMLLKSLENITLSTGENVQQQKIGDDYINQDVIKGILIEHLKVKLVVEKTPKGIYDGKGITLVDIENTIKVFDSQLETQLKILLIKYIRKKNEQNVDGLNNWLVGQEKTLSKIAFERLKQKIEEYENKSK